MFSLLPELTTLCLVMSVDLVVVALSGRRHETVKQNAELEDPR